MSMEYKKSRLTSVTVWMHHPTTNNFCVAASFQQLEQIWGLQQHFQFSNIFTSFHLSPKCPLMSFTIVLYVKVTTQALRLSRWHSFLTLLSTKPITDQFIHTGPLLYFSKDHETVVESHVIEMIRSWSWPCRSWCNATRTTHSLMPCVSTAQKKCPWGLSRCRLKWTVCFPPSTHPIVNLQVTYRWLYSLFLAIDANFCLKRCLVSNNIKDPGLSCGWGYFVEEGQYKTYLCNHADVTQEVSFLN
jgi:hypothetical protein